MLRGVQQKKWKKKWVRNEPAFFAGRWRVVADYGGRTVKGSHSGASVADESTTRDLNVEGWNVQRADKPLRRVNEERRKHAI